MDEALFSDQPAPELKDSLFSDQPAPKVDSETISPPYSPMNPNEPGLQDVSVPDAMMVQGVGGLAKTGLGLGARGVGATLNAIPATENIVPSIADTSNDMLLKSMGSRAGQINQLGGIEAARDAANVGRQAGADTVFSTERGRMDNLKNLIENQGKQIGNLRTQAGNASPDVLDAVKNNLQGKYGGEGLYSSEAGQIPKALNDVKRISGEGPLSYPTNAGIAKGATFLNNYASGNKLLQPTNAVTDVANELSRANNADIAQKLGSDKALEYLQALQNESGAMHLKPVLEKGMAREAVARGGGKGILQSLAQKAADTGGYRAASKGLNALHGALNEAPSLANTPQNALQTYLSQKDEDENEAQ